MNAKKATARTQRKRTSVNDYDRPSWTPSIAAAWSHIPPRVLYRLLEAGIVPCVAAGRPRTQTFPLARDGTRTRGCFRYVIPAESFKRWFNNLGPQETEMIRQAQLEAVEAPSKMPPTAA